jgi:inorganic pyrophosphatase
MKRDWTIRSSPFPSATRYADYHHKSELPAHVLREVRRFFEDYKALEHKQVVVEDMLGPEEAVRAIRDGLEL